MSRRFHPSHARFPSVSENNPYQPTTIPHTCNNHQRVPSIHQSKHRNGCHSDDTTFTNSYYECHRYVTSDRSYSDESGSTQLPCHYENDDESCRRFPREVYSSNRGVSRTVNPTVHKDVRRVYPQQLELYQEISTPALVETNKRVISRPQSSMSSEITTAIVDGCGGKCQTFENVCYFVLQLVFMMGILIGVSLCIAGLALRKSAAKNLQVLVYIGIMLAIVSGVLLGIQFNARSLARKRKMAVRNAKRAPIAMETLNSRNIQVQQPLMMVQEGQRVMPQVLQHDQQGIPWWRRKDIV